MKKRYPDCIRADGLCGVCSLANYGMNCHNKLIGVMLRLRSVAGISQQKLAEKSGVGIRQIQKYESGEYNTKNMTLGNAIAISDALDCSARELVDRDKE